MYLEFTIIPINSTCETYAYYILHKLARIRNICININRSYNDSLKIREQMCKRDDDVNIIIVNEEYSTKREIIVKYSKNNYKEEKQSLDDLERFLSSSNKKINEHDNWCIIN